MTSAMKTVLVVGGTSGIGEAFVRRFHALGKKVIATGRRQELLGKLKTELSGIDTRQWDISDTASIPTVTAAILKDYPKLDTILLIAGFQKSLDFLDPSTSTDSSITAEVTTNVTSQMLLARHFLPHLHKLAQSGVKTAFMLTSSGLAYIPIRVYPVYCPTKAAIHSFALCLRQQVNATPEGKNGNLTITEIAPPYVDTGLDSEHREKLKSEGKSSPRPPMPLEEYMENTMQQLEEGGKKEVAVGYSALGVGLWRESFGKQMGQMGLDC